MPYHRLHDPERLQALIDAVLAVDADLDLSSVLHRVVSEARALIGARYGALAVLDPSGSRIAEFVHDGMDAAAVTAIGRLPEGTGILGLLIADPHTLRLDDLTLHPAATGFPPGHPVMRTFVGVPIRVGDRVFGNLYLAEKAGGAPFTAADESLVTSLARAVAVAVDNARLHQHVRELTIAAERRRIGDDLHDTVIQGLFATGLSLQSVAALVEDAEVRRLLGEAVADLDEVIRQVRTAVFSLGPLPPSRLGLRARILQVCNDATGELGVDPEVRFRGALDATVPDSVAGEMLQALRQALVGTARLAVSGGAAVEVAVADGSVCFEVAHDGPVPRPHPGTGGPGAAGTGTRTGGAASGGGASGLMVPDDMRARAEHLGGTVVVTAGPGGGPALRWAVPLSRPGGEADVSSASEGGPR